MVIGLSPSGDIGYTEVVKGLLVVALQLTMLRQIFHFLWRLVIFLRLRDEAFHLVVVLSAHVEWRLNDNALFYVEIIINKFTLTFALMGIVESPPPSVFSRLPGAAVSGTPYHNSFPHSCENFRSRSRKVMSPSHVRWPHLIKSLNDRQSYTDWTIALKFSVVDTSNSVYKIYISEFWFRVPKVRSTLWPLHYVNGRKFKSACFGRKSFLTLKHQVTGRIDTLNRKIPSSDPSSWPQGHFMRWNDYVMKGHQQFFGNQRWKHMRCVQDDDTDRMVCHMTFFHQVMILILTLI